jgi:hypothetical protein
MDALSLYAKQIGLKGRRPHVLLVEAVRVGANLKVSDGWRLYPEDVRLTSAMSPLDLLGAFLAVHGVPLVIGDAAQTSSIILYARIRRLAENTPIASFGALPQGATISSRMHMRVTPEGWIEVAMAYAINDTSYKQAWRRNRAIPG